jgi:pimeloyl-ACP methyl ester carboxylesterase
MSAWMTSARARTAQLGGVIAALLAACSGSGEKLGAVDSGADIGIAIRVDGGAGGDGAADAQSGTDAVGPEVGPRDLGVADGGVALDSALGSTLAVALPCTDAIGDVYVTPSGLPALTAVSHGDIVRCARDTSMDQSTVQAALVSAGAAGVEATGGVDLLRVMYRAQRGSGNDGTSSARVYLPHPAVTSTRALIVIGHPSTGLADGCAPSKDANALRNLALPFAARGYIVIAPDYPGLGDETTQSYLDNHDQGYAMLDAARALPKLFAPGALGTRAAMIGHSQGGGAALSAQALAHTYAPDLQIGAVAVMAPEWETRINSFQYVSALRSPTSLTIAFGITTSVVVEYEAYAWWENTVGAGQGGQVFPAAFSSGIVNAINSLCLVEFGGYLQGMEFHVSDWLDDTLRQGFLACVDNPTGASCTGNGQILYQKMAANVLTGDPAGAPVLYIQGSSDIVMPPAEEAACNVAKLEEDGVSVETCVVDGASHQSVVGQKIGFAISWVEAVLSGSARPVCTNGVLPACTP